MPAAGIDPSFGNDLARAQVFPAISEETENPTTDALVVSLFFFLHVLLHVARLVTS